MALTTEQEIIALLQSTKRVGINELIEYMVSVGFFTQPASTRFHGSEPGGLAAHSLGVYKLLAFYAPRCKLEPSTPGARTYPLIADNYIIAGLLHDLCKAGAYLSTGTAYKWNRAHPKGHGLLSCARIAKYLPLQPIEELMIRYHMGPYGCFEFDPTGFSTEYHMRGDQTKSSAERYGESLANAWFHNPVTKLMYFCDEFETMGLYSGAPLYTTPKDFDELVETLHGMWNTKDLDTKADLIALLEDMLDLAKKEHLEDESNGISSPEEQDG